MQSWHCDCGVIRVDQEEGRRYYTTLENTFSQLDLFADCPVYLHSCCSVEEEVIELLIHFAMDTRTQELW